MNGFPDIEAHSRVILPPLGDSAYPTISGPKAKTGRKKAQWTSPAAPQSFQSLRTIDNPPSSASLSVIQQHRVQDHGGNYLPPLISAAGSHQVPAYRESEPIHQLSNIHDPKILDFSNSIQLRSPVVYRSGGPPSTPSSALSTRTKADGYLARYQQKSNGSRSHPLSPADTAVKEVPSGIPKRKPRRSWVTPVKASPNSKIPVADRESIAQQIRQQMKKAVILESDEPLPEEGSNHHETAGDRRQSLFDFESVIAPADEESDLNQKVPSENDTPIEQDIVFPVAPPRRTPKQPTPVEIFTTPRLVRPVHHQKQQLPPVLNSKPTTPDIESLKKSLEDLRVLSSASSVTSLHSADRPSSIASGLQKSESREKFDKTKIQDATESLKREYEARINSLECRTGQYQSQINQLKSFRTHLNSIIANSEKNSKDSSKMDYFSNLIILRHLYNLAKKHSEQSSLQQRNVKQYQHQELTDSVESVNPEDNLGLWNACIEFFEIQIGILPQTRAHKRSQQQLNEFLNFKQFSEARDLLRKTAKRADFLKIRDRETINQGLEQAEYLINRFHVINLIERGNQEDAYVLLNAHLYGFVKKFEGVNSIDRCENSLISKGFRHLLESKDALESDYWDLCRLFLFRFPTDDPQSLFASEKCTEEISADSVLLNWSWEEQLSQFWHDAFSAHRDRFGLESSKSGVHSFFSRFISELFVDRFMIIDETFPENLAELLQLSLIGRESRNLSCASSFTDNDTQNVIKPSSAPLDSADRRLMKATKEPISSPAKESVPITHTPLRPKPVIPAFSETIIDENIVSLNNTPNATELKLEQKKISGPLFGQVEAMDVVTDSRTGDDKKMISIWNLTKMELVHNHLTKKASAQCLKFYDTSAPGAPYNSLLIYAEYKDIYLFDWKRHQVVKRWDLHRNIVLQLDFLPFNQRRNITTTTTRSGVRAISLAFDHSIKIWDVMDQEETPRLIDKIHSSAGQPFTAFTIREDNNADGYELVVAQEKGMFKIYRLRGEGSLHLVYSVTVDSLKFFPRILSVVPCMFAGKNWVIVAAERDNRISIVDLEEHTIVKQFSGRFFCMDKKPDVQFSIFGKYISAGSLLPSQNHTFNPSPPSCPPPASTSNASSKRLNPRAQHLRPAAASDTTINMVNSVGAFVWSVDSGKLIKTVHVSDASESNERFVASKCHWILGKDEEVLLLACSDQRLRLYTVQ